MVVKGFENEIIIIMSEKEMEFAFKKYTKEELKRLGIDPELENQRKEDQTSLVFDSFLESLFEQLGVEIEPKYAGYKIDKDESNHFKRLIDLTIPNNHQEMPAYRLDFCVNKGPKDLPLLIAEVNIPKELINVPEDIGKYDIYDNDISEFFLIFHKIKEVHAFVKDNKSIFNDNDIYECGGNYMIKMKDKSLSTLPKDFYAKLRKANGGLLPKKLPVPMKKVSNTASIINITPV